VLSDGAWNEPNAESLRISGAEWSCHQGARGRACFLG
jgi:hypothetical protein